MYGALTRGPQVDSTQWLSTRLSARGTVQDAITVNCIGPALFPSGMTKYALGSEEIREMAAHHHPVGRYGCEEDMAGTALFLASPASSFINGSIPCWQTLLLLLLLLR